MTNTEDYLKSIEPKPNPYERDGKWYWYDETDEEQGPFDTYYAALFSLEDYIMNILGK